MKKIAMSMMVLIGFFLVFCSVGNTQASSIYSFDSDAEGWFGEPEEPITTSFNPSGPFDNGALVATFTSARNNVALEHALDPLWSTDTGFYSQVTFDIQLSSVSQITRSAFRIKNNTNDSLYLAGLFYSESGSSTFGSITSLGDNKFKVTLVSADPTLYSRGPGGSRDTIGLNLDIFFHQP